MEGNKMKKTYKEPSIKKMEIFDELLQTTSGTTGDNGTGYGGVDTGGKKDPEAKQYIPDEFHSVWSD